MREYNEHRKDLIASSGDATLKTAGAEEIYPKLIAPDRFANDYKLPTRWGKVVILVKNHDAAIRELKRAIPHKYRGGNS